MDPKETLTKIILLKNSILKQKKTERKTKYQTVALFNDISEAVRYRIPMRPIDISEDGKTFRCPRCKTLIESEDGTVDDYDLCCVCGQIWKTENTLLEQIEEVKRNNNE